MRSRYSAYARGLISYIIETTHQSGPAWEEPRALWQKKLQLFSKQTEFLTLEIFESTVEEDRGMVHFRAEINQPEGRTTLEEKSTFWRVDSQWLYYGFE